MPALDSWLYVLWIVFTDGEANLYTPTGTPAILRHLETEEMCQRYVDEFIDVTTEKNSDNEYFVKVDGVCFQVQKALGI